MNRRITVMLLAIILVTTLAVAPAAAHPDSASTVENPATGAICYIRHEHGTGQPESYWRETNNLLADSGYGWGAKFPQVEGDRTGLQTEEIPYDQVSPDVENYDILDTEGQGAEKVVRMDTLLSTTQFIQQCLA